MFLEREGWPAPVGRLAMSSSVTRCTSDAEPTGARPRGPEKADCYHVANRGNTAEHHRGFRLGDGGADLFRLCLSSVIPPGPRNDVFADGQDATQQPDSVRCAQASGWAMVTAKRRIISAPPATRRRLCRSTS